MAKRKEATEVVEEPPFGQQLDRYHEILRLGETVRHHQEVYEQQKQAAKTARENWENAVFALQRAIDRANDPQGELDFGEEA